jgi:hypothetical protein
LSDSRPHFGKYRLNFLDSDQEEIEKTAQELNEIGVLAETPELSSDFGSPLISELIIVLGTAGAFTAVAQIVLGFLARNKDKKLEVTAPDGTSVVIAGADVKNPEEFIEKFLSNRSKGNGPSKARSKK